MGMFQAGIFENGGDRALTHGGTACGTGHSPRRLIVGEAREVARGGPCADKEGGEGEEATSLGVVPEFAGTAGVPKGVAAATIADCGHAAGATAPIGRIDRSEQPQIGLAAPAGVGPHLRGPAGRAANRLGV